MRNNYIICNTKRAKQHKHCFIAMAINGDYIDYTHDKELALRFPTKKEAEHYIIRHGLMLNDFYVYRVV